MESWFGHAKDEIPLSGCGGFEEVKAAIADCIDYYNNVRPQIGLGWMVPREKRDCLLSRPACPPVGRHPFLFIAGILLLDLWSTSFYRLFIIVKSLRLNNRSMDLVMH